MITDIKIIEREGHQYAQINCRWCPVQLDIPIEQRHFISWMNGEYIQDAMPELSADLREMFISGTCPRCWEEMFDMNDGSGWTTYLVTTTPNEQVIQVHVGTNRVVVAAGTGDKSCFRPNFIGEDWVALRAKFEERGWKIKEME